MPRKHRVRAIPPPCAPDEIVKRKTKFSSFLLDSVFRDPVLNALHIPRDLLLIVVEYYTGPHAQFEDHIARLTVLINSRVMQRAISALNAGLEDDDSPTASGAGDGAASNAALNTSFYQCIARKLNTNTSQRALNAPEPATDGNTTGTGRVAVRLVDSGAFIEWPMFEGLCRCPLTSATDSGGSGSGGTGTGSSGGSRFPRSQFLALWRSQEPISLLWAVINAHIDTKPGSSGADPGVIGKLEVTNPIPEPQAETETGIDRQSSTEDEFEYEESSDEDSIQPTAKPHVTPLAPKLSLAAFHHPPQPQPQPPPILIQTADTGTPTAAAADQKQPLAAAALSLLVYSPDRVALVLAAKPILIEIESLWTRILEDCEYGVMEHSEREKNQYVRSVSNQLVNIRDRCRYRYKPTDFNLFVICSSQRIGRV